MLHNAAVSDMDDRLSTQENAMLYARSHSLRIDVNIAEMTIKRVVSTSSESDFDTPSDRTSQPDGIIA
jgi:hypothetical protein